MPQTRTRRRGMPAFTLIELAVVIALLGIVAALGAGIVSQTGRNYSWSTDTTDAFADARHALDRLAAELGNVAASSDISAIAPSSITFTSGGETQTYQKSGSTLVRNSETLAVNVSSFTLTYYKSDGALASAPGEVVRVAMELVITRNGQTASLRTETTPRALASRFNSWARGPTSPAGQAVIEYVPNSRSDYNEDVDFQIRNTGTADAIFGRLTINWISPTAYFERIDYTLSGQSEVVPWRYNDDPSGRWGNGETRDFNQSGHTTVTLPAGQTATMELENFRRYRTGYCTCSRDMDSSALTITFYNGSTQVGEITVPAKW